MSELPESWEWSTLGEAVEVLDSRRVPVNKKERAKRPGDVPYYGATGLVDTIDEALFDEELLLLGEDGVPFLDPHKPKAYLIAGPSWVNNHAHVLRAVPGATTNKFLCYYLNQCDYLPYVNGTTRLKLTQGAMRTIPVALPPLAEQQRIVDAVEEHLSRIEAAETRLTKARDRLTALEYRLYVDAFSSVEAWQRLADAASVITKGTTPTTVGFDYADSGVLFVKAESLEDGKINHDRCAHIGVETHDALSRSQLHEGDLLITIAGTLGRIGIVRANDVPANTNQAVSIVRLRDRKGLTAAQRWLSSPVAQRNLKTSGKGVGLQNLNLKQIGDMEVPLIGSEDGAVDLGRLDRQLEGVATVRSSLEEAVARLRGMRTSVLWAAFNGRLAPQDPTDEPASLLLMRIQEERATSEKSLSAKKKVKV